MPGHSLSLPMHFLSRRHNRRSDEYGGSIENRMRLLREVIEDTKVTVGDTCGVVVRLAVNELMGPIGITPEEEGRAVLEALPRDPAAPPRTTALSRRRSADLASLAALQPGFLDRDR